MGRALVLLVTLAIGCQEGPARAVQPLDQVPLDAYGAPGASATLTLPSAVKRSHVPRAGLLHGR
jgi:hypothetical protein